MNPLTQTLLRPMPRLRAGSALLATVLVLSAFASVASASHGPMPTLPSDSPPTPRVEEPPAPPSGIPGENCSPLPAWDFAFCALGDSSPWVDWGFGYGADAAWNVLNWAYYASVWGGHYADWAEAMAEWSDEFVKCDAIGGPACSGVTPPPVDEIIEDHLPEIRLD